MGVPEKEEKERRPESLFLKIAENIPILQKEMDIQIQKSPKDNK